MRINILYISFIFLILGCKKPESISVINDSLVNPVVAKDETLIADSLEVDTTKNRTTLLTEALKVDSFEHFNYAPFVFFKSGKLFCKDQTNAIYIYNSNDTTYSLILYNLEKNKWIIKDSISNIDISPIQFSTDFMDFNFDGYNDLYIQHSCSNGHAISYGNLLVYNRKENKLIRHLLKGGNIQALPKTKTIQTEEWLERNRYGQCVLRQYQYTWENDELKEKNKKIITSKD